MVISSAEEADGSGAKPTSSSDFTPLHERQSRSPAGSQHQTIAQEVLRSFESAEKRAQKGDEEGVIEDYLSTAAAAEAAHEWYIEAQCCVRVASFLVESSESQDPERAIRLYRRAALAFDRCGLHHEARTAGYSAMALRRRFAKELSVSRLQQGELWLYDVTSGFGHRPMRVVRTALLVMIGFGVMFWGMGGVYEVESKRPAGLMDSLYFSVTTFTTIGYGDFVPYPHARLLAMVEGVLGAFLVGFFVVVLWRRLSQG